MYFNGLLSYERYFTLLPRFFLKKALVLQFSQNRNDLPKYRNNVYVVLNSGSNKTQQRWNICNPELSFMPY